ncbi:MAG: DUF4125 family protein [Candidatus Dactylopiibacterium sp.]|nr:DUF4125 family protein [Candidatus Dactylopiibacterium sp.]
MSTLIDEIIALEWRAFDKVRNEGGRADCQDDFGTFEIMRKSQFLSWDAATRDAYYNDLLRATLAGRNLIQEKYARMMASTAPAQYATFAHTLPALNPGQLATIEEIIAQQLAWREAFAREWPHMSSQARLIRTEEDTPWGTSFETYLRGELGTYSEATLGAYRQMIADLRARGDNLTTIAMDHTARLYGYADLASAEAKLAAAA